MLTHHGGQCSSGCVLCCSTVPAASEGFRKLPLLLEHPFGYQTVVSCCMRRETGMRTSNPH